MLQLTYEITPDGEGMFDGRELARLLIEDAFKALTPYAALCPACSDALFTRIANEVLAAQHREGREKGKLPSAVWALDKAAPEIREAHFERARAELALKPCSNSARHHPNMIGEDVDDDFPF